MFILQYTSYFIGIIIIRFACGGFEKIDVPLLKKMGDAPRGTIFRVLVTFEPYQDSTLEKELEGIKGHLRSYKMYQILNMEANHTQYALIQALKAKVPKPSILQTIYLVNVLVVEATKEIILKFGLDRLPENKNILMVLEDGVTKREKGERSDGSLSTRAPLPDDWWKQEINALPWIQAGYDGTNIIIGVIDSGGEANHPELRPSWYGPNYGFREAYTLSKLPFDDQDDPHGTEVLGILTGYRTGLAPGSKWIMCADGGPLGSNLTADIRDSLTLECGEYLHCPDRASYCSRRPHVINNSWSFNHLTRPLSVFNLFNEMVEKWLSVGQMPVFSAGNKGVNGCETVGYPGSRQDVIQVGAVALQPATNISELRESSSRGPPIHLYPNVDYVGHGLYKPDLVAPGEDILTTTLTPRGAGSTYMAGTSAAAAVVSGAIALILSRNINLDYNEVKAHLYANTRTGSLTDPKLWEMCGNVSDFVFPNFKFGRGFLQLPDPLSLGQAVRPSQIPPD